jgi:hypothetical protein
MTFGGRLIGRPFAIAAADAHRENIADPELVDKIERARQMIA